MGFFNKLIFSVGSSAASLGTNAAFNAANYRKTDGKLQFISNKGYDNIYVYAAARTAMQIAMAEANSIVYHIIHKNEVKHAAEGYKEYKEGSKKEEIIKQSRSLSEQFRNDLGVVWKYRGEKYSDEGLLLWIKSTSGKTVKVPIKTYWDKIKGLSYRNYSIKEISQMKADAKKWGRDFVGPNDYADYETNIECPGEIAFVDMTAITNMQSTKNVILTRVQGRDYSRKEIVSNGDFQFTVSGKVVGNMPDIYPREEVSKLVKLMQYKGAIQVYGLLFEQFNVKQVLIKDFRMNQRSGFKNEQPYSFTCVAVEPDHETEVIEDTIADANYKLSNYSKKTGWAKLLDDIKDSAIKQASNTISLLTSKVI